MGVLYRKTEYSGSNNCSHLNVPLGKENYIDRKIKKNLLTVIQHLMMKGNTCANYFIIFNLLLFRCVSEYHCKRVISYQLYRSYQLYQLYQISVIPVISVISNLELCNFAT